MSHLSLHLLGVQVVPVVHVLVFAQICGDLPDLGVELDVRVAPLPEHDGVLEGGETCDGQNEALKILTLRMLLLRLFVLERKNYLYLLLKPAETTDFGIVLIPNAIQFILGLQLISFEYWLDL